MNKISGGDMKNICFVNSYIFWGGGEKSYFKYGKELQKMGNKIYFLVKNYRKAIYGSFFGL